MRIVLGPAAFGRPGSTGLERRLAPLTEDSDRYRERRAALPWN
jgi:hypothetical protein